MLNLAALVVCFLLKGEKLRRDAAAFVCGRKILCFCSKGFMRPDKIGKCLA